MTSARAGRSGNPPGFTLIEILAVTLIFALLAAIALPNLGIRTSRLLDDDGRRLAGTLEFARQRAVMTGREHRVFLDLDRGAYQIESWGTGDDEAADADSAEAGEDAARDAAQVSLSPPPQAERDFQPLVGALGDVQKLDSAVRFAGVQLPDGAVANGQVGVVFQRDGTSEPADIVLTIDSGRRVILHVAPLEDSVRLERVD